MVAKKTKKTNIQDTNKLLSKQFDIKTQMNDMLNKTLSIVAYSPERQREQITNDLEQKYLNAQTNLQTAPLQVDETKKNYYIYKNGRPYYNDMLEKELKQKATQITQQISIKFKEEADNANTMNAYYNTDLINSENTKELYDEYLKKNAELEKLIKNSHGDVLTNDRKTYYENSKNDEIKSWNKFLRIGFYILVVVYLISIVVTPLSVDSSRIKQIVLLIFFIIYPFLINYLIDNWFIKWYNSYYSILDSSSKNVYFTL